MLSDGTREVELYVLDRNPHANGLLIGYVPDAKLGFVTDIWSPGPRPLPDKLNPALTSLVAGVKKAGSPRRSSRAGTAASPTTRRSPRWRASS